MKQDTLFLPLVLICLATMVLLFKGKPSGNHTSKSFLSEYREHTRLIHKATSGEPGVHTTKQLRVKLILISGILPNADYPTVRVTPWTRDLKLPGTNPGTRF